MNIKKYFNSIGLLLICFSLLAVGCKNKNKDPKPDAAISVDDYDRTTMLTNFANGYIVPAYSEYKTKTSNLKSTVTAFVASPTTTTLQDVKTQWETTLLTWQDVAFLEFGPAANISLRGQTNVYPTDTVTILSNIISGAYNLQEAANFDAKGFQAIDYLINGKGASNQTVVNYYIATANAGTYLQNITNEIDNNASAVYNEWLNSYTSSFINNSASNAQGSAVSDVVNALTQHYETYIRKGKIGLPGGFINSFSVQLPQHVEALYYGQSLPFVHRSLTAIQNFISGKTYVAGTNGAGLDDYLSFMSAQSGGVALQTVIDTKLTAIKTKLGTINDPLSKELTTNNKAVEAVYVLLQQLVPNLKVEMTDALGVLVTYQDADGD